MQSFPNLSSSTAVPAYQLAEQALDLAIDIEAWTKDTDIKINKGQYETFVTRFEEFFINDANLDILATYIKTCHGLDSIDINQIKPCLNVILKHWQRIIHVMEKDPYMQRQFPELAEWKTQCLKLHSLLLAELSDLENWR